VIRIRLTNGDRTVEFTADDAAFDPDRTPIDEATTAARNLWAIVVAAGPATPMPCTGRDTCRPDTPCPGDGHWWSDEPAPRIEAGGMGFTADLADQRTYPRPAPDLVPGVTGDPQWDPEDDRCKTPDCIRRHHPEGTTP
jgi:hypothetical protein